MNLVFVVANSIFLALCSYLVVSYYRKGQSFGVAYALFCVVINAIAVVVATRAWLVTF